MVNAVVAVAIQRSEGHRDSVQVKRRQARGVGCRKTGAVLFVWRLPRAAARAGRCAKIKTFVQNN